MHFISFYDALAVGWFIVVWIGYGVLVDRSKQRNSSVTGLMGRYRHQWMQQMAARDVRIVDTQINQHLQQGAAFFASTTLLALGGAITMMAAPEKAVAILESLPAGFRPSRALWELKTAGLSVIFIYGFFKFSWAYRLFNYCAILIGATPFCTEGETPCADALAMARRAADMNAYAAHQFNRGQRALFFALAYLGWFAGPLLFIITTSAVLVVLHRRQFWSKPLKVLQ